jgi:acetyltransferase-like isoleucine patch superfamily enzyme/GNAT superfamily N-acetyltransferase
MNLPTEAKTSLALKAKTLFLMLRKGEKSDILKELARRFYSDEASYILRRDLMRPLQPRPTTKIPIRIRPMSPSDLPVLIRERPRRLPVLRSNIPSCYLAIAEDGSICFMQWVIQADQQNRFRPYFKGELAAYESDTLLFEFSYTPERFRGHGIMAAALAEIIEQASPRGARSAITYVRTDNVASLKSCARAGFRPYMLRTESWRGFRLRQAFRVLEQPALYPFERESTTHIAAVKGTVTNVQKSFVKGTGATNQKNLLRRSANRILHKLARTVPGSTTLRPALHRWRGVAIGHNVFIGDDVYLENEFPELVEIGDGTAIGLRTVIMAHVGRSDKKTGLLAGRIVIGKNVWIGACSFIATSPGSSLTIGDGAVIGACSVIVNKNIPPHAFVLPPVTEQVGSERVTLTAARSTAIS